MVIAKQKKLGLQRITGETTYNTSDSSCDADRQTEKVRTSKFQNFAEMKPLKRLEVSQTILLSYPLLLLKCHT